MLPLVLAAGDVGSHYLDESSHCGTFYGSNTESRALQGRAIWNEARALLGLPPLAEERNLQSSSASHTHI